MRHNYISGQIGAKLSRRLASRVARGRRNNDPCNAFHTPPYTKVRQRQDEPRVLQVERSASLMSHRRKGFRRNLPGTITQARHCAIGSSKLGFRRDHFT
jgi:hypothetical protein